MTNQNNAAQAAAKEIHKAFELSYAMDADDPANASAWNYFTNGWRACILSQVRAGGVQAGDARENIAAGLQDSAYCTGLQRGFMPGDQGDHEGLRKALEPREGYVKAIKDASAALASAPAANTMPIRLSAEVLEYLKEGIENATGCEESDVDHDFANELARLMTGPLYTAPIASAPVADRTLAYSTPQSKGPNVCEQTSAPVAGEAQRPALAVWYGSMPESNGKINWTAILHRKGDGLLDGPHVTIDRSEYPYRVRYEADRVRYLVGEIADEPFILDYDADKCDATPQASEAVRILFPTHLRKMWSGGEVQAWLDAHQSVTVPKPSAKGGFDRYRKWQAEQVAADGAPPNNS